MKRHFTLLLLFLSALNYAQVGELQSDGSRTVTIGQPDALTVVTVDLVPVSCKGGSTGEADLTVTGGTGTYSTSWDGNAYIAGTSITGLTAGAHIYTIKDANNCTLSGTVNIVEPLDVLSVGITKTDVKCFGEATGTIELTAVGGNGSYTYDWGFSSKSGLLAGTYPYTVTDSKYCTITGSVTIAQPASPLSVSCPPTAVTHIKCFGQATGEIHLTVTGGAGSYAVSLDGGVTYPYGTTITGLSAGTYKCTVKDANDCTQSILVDITGPTAGLTVGHSKTDVSCFGGSNGAITLTISDGTAPYTFLWNDGATTANRTNLLLGNYSYTVSDTKGCSISDSVTITQPTALAVSTSLTNVSCFGGSNGTVVLSISGGTAPYTLLWNDGSTALSRTNLPSGNYSYTITDAKGCVLPGSITITQPPVALTLGNTQTNVTCNGDSNGGILLNITGGTMPYSSLWSDGITSKDRNSIPVGSYSVMVTDANGCSANSGNIIITAPVAINIPVPAITNVTIFGQSTGAILLVDPTGGAGGYRYKWTYNLDPLFNKLTKNISGLKAGLYTLLVTDSNNCSTSQTFKIDQPDELLVALQKTKEIACFGNENGELTAKVTGGVLNYSYQWYKNGVSIPETTNILKNIGYGIYKVTVTDSQGAIKTTVAFDLKQPDELIVSVANQTNVLCHNATTGAIDINIIGGTLPYDIQWQKDGLDYALSEDLTSLAAGNYEVIITDKNGCGAILQNSVRITQPAPLQIASFTKTDLTGFETNNGSIAVTVSGGNPNYKYEWRKDADPIIIGTTSSINNLSIGTYHLIVKDASDCTLPQVDYNITQPDKLQMVSLTQAPNTNINCHGDSSAEFTAIVIGGVKEYTFEWLNTTTGVKYSSNETITAASTISKASNLGAGNYIVSVKDQNSNILFGTNTFTIAQPDKLVFTYSQKNVSCFGDNSGSVKLAISGGILPYTIICGSGTIDNANATVSGLTEGTYNIIVADANSCQTQQTIIITEPQNSISITNQIITPTTGYGLATGQIAITVAGGTAGYTYEWKDNTSTVVGTNNPILGNIPAGLYSILVTDANGCTTSNSYAIQQPTKPLLSETHLQAKCYGLLGSLNATANGGATYNQNQSDRIYSYKLKNKTTGITTTITGNIANFTDIADGDYSLTATDTGGIDSNTIDVQFTQPSPIVVTLNSIQNVSCFGGQDGAIAISVSGGTPLIISGTPQYVYQWKRKNTPSDSYESFMPTALNALYAGIYAVEVRDANYNSTDTDHCIAVLENIEITQPADFGFDIDKITYTNPSAVNGNDGKLHFEIAGGKSNYEYKFYTKNAQGIETVLQTISNSSLKTVDFNGLAKDHYYISAKDDTGCTKYADFDFSDNPLTVSLSQTQNITCNNANNAVLTANANGGFGSKTISWYRNDVLFSSALLSNGSDLNLVQPGSYYAIIRDTKKVEVTSNTIIVSQPDPVIFSTIQDPVKCLGDSNGKISITASGGNGNFRYRYFYKGSLVTDWQNFTNGANTAILDLAEGDYIIQVQDTQKCSSTDATIKITSPTPLSINAIASIPATGNGLSNGSISITALGGNGNYSYNWFKEDNTNLNQLTNTAGNLAAGKYYAIITDAKGCNLTSPVLEVTEPPLLESSIAVQNVILCNGDKNGSIKPTVIGGFLKSGENYTYQWFEDGNATVLATSTVLNGIGKGSYYVLATDSNGNQAKSKSLLVTDPPVLNNTLTSDFTRCGDANDWAITATPAGGTSPYSFIWNTGDKTANLQNVPPANYNVLVTDKHGCTITKNITITAPVHLDTTEKIIKPTCFGGSDATITLSPTGGQAPYTYLWDTGETSSVLRKASAKKYTVAVTDYKGCVINKSYTIENPPKEVINLGEDVTLCLDQTLTINGSIADDKAQYSWTSTQGFTSNKPIITVSEAADYTLLVTNKLGCKAEDTFKLSRQNTPISAEFAVSSQAFISEKVIVVDISKPEADSVEWILPAEATILSKNKDYAELSFSKTGEYELTMNTKKGNCTATQTKKILIVEGEYQKPEGLDTQKKFDIKIYPNPSNGVFNVDVALDKIMPAHVKVYSLNNNLIIDSKYGEGKDSYSFPFSLSGLTTGVYFVLFESEQGNQLRKIIIQ